MGTRSTITFVENDTELVKIYQQYDGYIDGVGHELAKWLMKMTLVNGFSDASSKNTANGVGCLAAQFIKDYKEGIGGFYIVPLDTSNDNIDYNYRVVIKPTYSKTACNDVTEIIVTNWNETEPVFKGSPAKLLEFKEDDE